MHAESRLQAMTSVQLNAQIWHDMSVLASSEPMMKRVAKYLRKLVREQNDPTLMTREEFYEKLDRAEEEYRQGKYYEMLPGENLDDFLKRVG